MVAAFPPARHPDRPIDNLPLEQTSFVGREREVAQIKRLISERRLLTLCGPGGSGKSRLALAVARDAAEEFGRGTWWVELAPISEPGLVTRGKYGRSTKLAAELLILLGVLSRSRSEAAPYARMRLENS